ncbi:helix-turn-helix transcriptional regulator [Sphingomonas sp. C8-2]|jgi:DNA-binding CsgD family transcriptional regulator|nr:helix-turn-helix transcriptional regulator [Sphingomonas sp. C8-2]
MRERRRALERRAAAVTLLVLLQSLATIFFVADVARDISVDGWSTHLLVETAATIALVTGVVFGALQLRWLIVRTRLDETAIATARGAMSDLVRQRFLDWQLTAAEADVALFALKGFDATEIAALRGAASGTIRAQLTRIYAKTGVHSQVGLMALMVEDLIELDAIRNVGSKQSGDGK